MEVGAPDIQGLDLRLADLDAGRAVVRVPVTVDLHPRACFVEPIGLMMVVRLYRGLPHQFCEKVEH